MNIKPKRKSKKHTIIPKDRKKENNFINVLR